jgi:hypothetical protein
LAHVTHQLAHSTNNGKTLNYMPFDCFHRVLLQLPDRTGFIPLYTDNKGRLWKGILNPLYCAGRGSCTIYCLTDIGPQIPQFQSILLQPPGWLRSRGALRRSVQGIFLIHVRTNEYRTIDKMCIGFAVIDHPVASFPASVPRWHFVLDYKRYCYFVGAEILTSVPDTSN